MLSHHVGNIATLDEFIANSNALPNLVEVASDAGLAGSSDFYGLVGI